MALPKLLQKLFTNGGAGDKLNKSIVPDLDYLPTSGGTINGSVTINGVEIATLNTASRNLGYTTMVNLGFSNSSTVTIVEFFQKLAEKGYTANNSVLWFGYAYSESASVTDGTTTFQIVGGTLYLGQNTLNTSNDYGTAWGFFVPAEGNKLCRFVAYKNPSAHGYIYLYEPGGGLSIASESYGGSYWYRKYSDGWIEQGGVSFFSENENNLVITLPIAFSPQEYTITFCTNYSPVSFPAWLSAKNATTFTVSRSDRVTGMGVWWYACGK